MVRENVGFGFLKENIIYLIKSNNKIQYNAFINIKI